MATSSSSTHNLFTHFTCKNVVANLLNSSKKSSSGKGSQQTFHLRCFSPSHPYSLQHAKQAHAEGTALPIQDTGARRKYVVSVTLRLLYPRKETSTHFTRGRLYHHNLLYFNILTAPTTDRHLSALRIPVVRSKNITANFHYHHM